MKKTFEFVYPLLYPNSVNHFTDLLIMCANWEGLDKQPYVEVINVAYFGKGEYIGSDLKEFIRVTAPDLLESIRNAAVNGADSLFKKAHKLYELQDKHTYITN